MSEPFDLSRSLTFLEQDSTVIAVIGMSQSSWLVAAVIPGVERQPFKKLDADEEALLKLLHRWRNEANRAGREIKRIVVAYEAGRGGFWLARWLRTRDVEAYVIHPTSVAVSREHRRAKTDRLDTELLKRAFLGWLHGERRHCSMAAIPTVAEEDARRPNRERENLVGERTRVVNQMKAILARLGIRSFPADPAQSRGKARRSAHGGRDAVAGEHVCGAAPSPRAARRAPPAVPRRVSWRRRTTASSGAGRGRRRPECRAPWCRAWRAPTGPGSRGCRCSARGGGWRSCGATCAAVTRFLISAMWAAAW